MKYYIIEILEGKMKEAASSMGVDHLASLVDGIGSIGLSLLPFTTSIRNQVQADMACH